MDIYLQILWLLLLAMPIACIAWTITQEEVFREPREYCIQRSQKAGSIVRRKFYYLLTCPFCLSHYVTLFFLFFTGYRLLLADWRGYVLAGFSLVWVANLYMNVYALIRQGLKKEKAEITVLERTRADLP
jgi:hypothetical protein